MTSFVVAHRDNQANVFRDDSKQHNVEEKNDDSKKHISGMCLYKDNPTHKKQPS